MSGSPKESDGAALVSLSDENAVTATSSLAVGLA
jgi:hypothetical protein